MKYLEHYPQELKDKVKLLIDNKTLGEYITNKYETSHNINNDKLLYEYTMNYKNKYFKKFNLKKVIFDGQIRNINEALGLHVYKTSIQGNKLKTQNQIKIANTFKNVPEEFLQMIIVHELCHLKERNHDKAFYSLCKYILPSYAQYEFDFRLYLTHLETFGKLY